MKVSELSTLLSKVSQYAQDADIVLKAVEGDVESVIHSLGVELGSNGDPTSNTVTINHGPTAPVEPAPEPAAAEPAAATVDVSG